ncbi:MAG: hypothetical protein OQL20_06830, partial [Sedimenticola sp.]|nr:hypothetical protein [Sedimenticola sp.]
MTIRHYAMVIPVLFSINAMAAGADADLKMMTKKPTKLPSAIVVIKKPVTAEQAASDKKLPTSTQNGLPAVQGIGAASGPGGLNNPALRKLPENNAARGLGNAREVIPNVPNAP